MCMSVLPVCMHVYHMCAELMGFRRGYRISWNWSDVWGEDAGAGNQIPILARLTSALNDRTIFPPPPTRLAQAELELAM